MSRYLIATFLMVLALIVGANLAQADCLSACIAAKDCSLNYSGACSSAVSDCSIECMRDSGPAFGAIAYDAESGAFGYAFQYPSADAAAAFALSKCAENGTNCAVVSTFSNACAALAAGRKDGRPITATVVADSKESAEEKALATCNGDGAEDCSIETWSCSYP